MRPASSISISFFLIKKSFFWFKTGNFTDLFIADRNLPQLVGIEFVQRLKESGYFRSIPIIILGHSDNSSDRNQCIKHGAAEYIAKPYNPEDLLIQIQKLLF